MIAGAAICPGNDSRRVESLVSAKSKCMLCNGSHHLSSCEKFSELRHYKQVELAKRERLCFRCLSHGHVAGKCKSKISCAVNGCTNPNHHTLLHKHIPQDDEEESSTKVVISMNVNQSKSKLSCLPDIPIVPVKVCNGRNECETYALLDSGSQQTFYTKELADMLQLKGDLRSLRLKPCL